MKAVEFDPGSRDDITRRLDALYEQHSSELQSAFVAAQATALTDAAWCRACESSTPSARDKHPRDNDPALENCPCC